MSTKESTRTELLAKFFADQALVRLLGAPARWANVKTTIKESSHLDPNEEDRRTYTFEGLVHYKIVEAGRAADVYSGHFEIVVQTMKRQGGKRFCEVVNAEGVKPVWERLYGHYFPNANGFPSEDDFNNVYIQKIEK